MMGEENRSFSDIGRLTSGKSITRNTMWSILGILLPLAAATLAIPSLIHHMGVARFGLLTILWLILSYFSLFDLGLGQAVARIVAERIGAGADHTLPTLLATAEKSCLVLGTVGGILLFATSHWIGSAMAPHTPDLAAEASGSLRLIALSMPLVVGTMGWAGALQGVHEFKYLSLIRALIGIWTFAVPALAAQWSATLITAAAVLVAGRVLAWILQYRVIRKHSPINWVAWSADDLHQFLRFGGWLTVSKVTGPLMVYFDRFVIAGLLGASAVAYYSTPFEIVFRLLMFPATLAQVLMPAMAMVGQGSRRLQMTSVASRVILVGTAFVALVIVLFARPALEFWVGSTFASHGAVVLQILALGLVVNGVAQVPFNQLLAMGRSDLTAQLHLLELAPYGAALWWAVLTYGIAGAATVWVARTSIDTIALCWLVARHESNSRSAYLTLSIQTILTIVLLAILVEAPLNGLLRITLVCISFAAGTAILWPFITGMLNRTSNPSA